MIFSNNIVNLHCLLTAGPFGCGHYESLITAGGDFQLTKIAVGLTVGAADGLVQLWTIFDARTLALSVPLAVSHADGVVVAFDVGAAISRE